MDTFLLRSKKSKEFSRCVLPAAMWGWLGDTTRRRGDDSAAQGGFSHSHLCRTTWYPSRHPGIFNSIAADDEYLSTTDRRRRCLLHYHHRHYHRHHRHHRQHHRHHHPPAFLVSSGRRVCQRVRYLPREFERRDHFLRSPPRYRSTSHAPRSPDLDVGQRRRKLDRQCRFSSFFPLSVSCPLGRHVLPSVSRQLASRDSSRRWY